ncbi:MAG: thioredoxin family protein [Desulfurococcaceae archaeon]|jgi:thioredoxin-like negative regulator of GroEL
MYELKSREELVRAVKGNEIVLIEYYESGNKDCQIMYESMKELSKYADKVILFCRVNVKEHPEIADVDEIPAIRVYYRGELVFEQFGALSTVGLNLKVIRRSIREVFTKRNIYVRI